LKSSKFITYENKVKVTTTAVYWVKVTSSTAVRTVEEQTHRSQDFLSGFSCFLETFPKVTPWQPYQQASAWDIIHPPIRGTLYHLSLAAG
jgi:hypothetical protein